MKEVLVDAFLSVDGTDLSDHVRTITLEYSADEVDNTAMGAGTHTMATDTLKNWTLTVEFYQDYAAGSVDATLFSKVAKSCALEVRAKKGVAVSATNPKYTATGVLLSYQPVGGSVGENAMAPVTFRPAGTGTLTRAIA